jgi:hypothetical protein
LARAAVALAGFAVVTPSHAQGSLSVKDVMRRVESYVAGYGEKASIVVCTERYVQETETSALHDARSRTLVSDFAIVKADAIRGWLGFRDVVEVDGRRVADRDDRLARVLMASQGRFDEARRLSDESARFNIGTIERNFNVPTSALFFFVPDNHDRFKFAARRVTDEGAWEIAFQEKARPTLIRTPDGEPVSTAGTIWAMPEDGTVLRTLLETQLLNARRGRPQIGKGRIEVRYRRVESLNMWLPASMDESFDAIRDDVRESVSGHADYDNYRTFTTTARIR